MTDNRRILIVDDTPANIKILNETLRGEYAISVATSGQDALDLVHSQATPDLILLDVMMPEMDGYEVCQRLKANPATEDIPVLFVTAMGEIADETHGLELGAVDYIRKPFSPPIVRARVHNHMELKLQRDHLSEAFEQIRRQKDALSKAYGDLEGEQAKSEKLLLNIFPAGVVSDLKQTGRTTPQLFEAVTVLFSDIVGFTQLSSGLDPRKLIEELNELFEAFDNIIERHECERIKTVGDAYLAVCGLPEPHDRHAENIMNAAFDMVRFLERRHAHDGMDWQTRIGIHSGEVVAGVVGVKKYIYDVFGDTINMASRMESNSAPMRINVSETTRTLLADRCHFLERSAIEVKGKGRLKMYFAEPVAPENSS